MINPTESLTSFVAALIELLSKHAPDRADLVADLARPATKAYSATQETWELWGEDELTGPSDNQWAKYVHGVVCELLRYDFDLDDAQIGLVVEGLVALG